MDWRTRLFTTVGPGLLGGITFRQWKQLLRDQHLQIDATYLPRAASITLQSLGNSLHARREQAKFRAALENIQIQPPIFVLGHWRSGTTHLHQLLAQDQQFAFPNSYQTAFPHTFLSTEASHLQRLSFFVPKRRPMDNMALSLSLPQEDEFALCTLCLKSPCMSWVFPRERSHFRRYLTFRDASPADVGEWKAALLLFLKKLTLKYGRTLVLKSPPHTARVRLLLEMFPGAKFVHIHRNPFVVFQSTRKTFEAMFQWQGLQKPQGTDLDEWILDQYREMYDVFFEERPLIPSGHYHEMAFEDLERDPLGEMCKLYASLSLPGFSEATGAMQSYLLGLGDYRKNEFPDLTPQLKNRISEMWHRSFNEWRYPDSRLERRAADVTLPINTNS